MKNAITFLLLICSITLSAQQSHFSIGLEGGPDYADLRGNSVLQNNLKGKIFYNAGIAVNYHLNSRWEIKPGVYYETKGAKMDIELTNNIGTTIGEVESREIFKYFTIPLLVRFSINSRINYFVNAGPFISILHKQTWKMDKIEGYPKIDIDNTEYYKPLDYGITFGIGVSKNVCNNWNLSLELRDNLGLADVSEPVDGYETTIKTNTVSLLLGVTYKFISKKTEEVPAP